MSFFALLLLGILQGLTEFLPVSSSGHLLLFSSLFGIEEGLFVSIVFHVASLVAVVIVLRKEIWALIKNPFSKQTLFLAIASAITAVMAILIMPILKGSFEGFVLPITFALTAIILFLAEIKTRDKIKTEKFSFKHACVVGLAQGFALFPGLSRSGTTISAGLFAGAEKKECAKFSFLLSIPTVLGSLFLEIYDVVQCGMPIDVNIAGLIVGCVICCIVSFASIKFMIKVTERVNFKWFAVYLSVASIVSMILFW